MTIDLTPRIKRTQYFLVGSCDMPDTDPDSKHLNYIK